MREEKKSGTGGATRLRPAVMRRGRPDGGLRSRRQPPVPPPMSEHPRCFYEVVADCTTRGSLDDKKLRVTRRILFLGRRWRNLMDEALRSTGDSHARWVTLLWVDMMAGRANLGELAEQIAVELPTLVRLLNRLERERLVERRALGGSNREKTVVLTVKGKRALVQMSAVINGTRRKFLEDVDEQRIDAALKLLDDLLAKYARVVMWPGNGE
jgi:MarR family transcriptional regulator, transcriptional regulator for hemolysin